MKKLYKFYINETWVDKCVSFFVREEEDVLTAMGKTIQVENLLGNYISVKLDNINIKEISDNKEFIELFEKNEMKSHFNPIESIY